MRDQEIVGLYEAYQQVHSQPQELTEEAYLIERDARRRPAGGKTYKQEMDAINAREAAARERAAARKSAKPSKSLTPGERHEQEKAERAAKKAGSGSSFSQYRMTGSGGHGSEYQNPLAVRREEADLFDYILEYLVAEGYADTNENAIAIMSNMSEEWRQSIIVEQRAYATAIDGQTFRDYNNDNKTPAQIDREARMKAFSDKRSKILQGANLVPGV